MSIYKIAEMSNVSTATVSKVLNGRDGVSESVRAKVLDIARRENFMPKTVLAGQKNVAVVSSRDYGCVFTSDFMMGIIHGISDYAFERGYNIMVIPAELLPKNKQEFELYCRKNHLFGLVFGNLSKNDTYVQDIAGVVPIVTINANLQGEKLYSVNSDDFLGGYSAVQYLYEMGHRRIGFISYGLKFESNFNKLEGYKKAMTDLGMNLDYEFIIDYDALSSTTVCHRIESLKKSGKPITALIAVNDHLALGIMNQLRLISVECPRDISIIGFDDYSYSSQIYPALTTVKQILYEKGRLSAQIVCGDDIDPEFEALRDSDGRYVFKTQLIVRETVKRLTLD